MSARRAGAGRSSCRGPAAGGVTAGKRPDYLIVTTNVPLSGVARTGGKDRIDALIRQCALPIGLTGWQIWDEAKIATLLDANPQVRQAFAANRTASGPESASTMNVQEPRVSRSSAVTIALRRSFLGRGRKPSRRTHVRRR
jgi:hypothetical protein